MRLDEVGIECKISGVAGGKCYFHLLLVCSYL